MISRYHGRRSSAVQGNRLSRKDRAREKSAVVWCRRVAEKRFLLLTRAVAVAGGASRESTEPQQPNHSRRARATNQGKKTRRFWGKDFLSSWKFFHFTTLKCPQSRSGRRVPTRHTSRIGRSAEETRANDDQARNGTKSRRSI